MIAKRKLILTARDRNLFEFIFEQRVATQEQLARTFFADRSVQAIHRRLSKLYKAGYLTKFGVMPKGRLVSAHSLTDKGIKEISQSFKFEITRPLCKSDSILHDIRLTDIRRRFEKFKMVSSYLSENVLQACGGFAENDQLKPFVHLNSDAALNLSTPNGEFKVAFEYEASEKGSSRYAKKLTSYYFASEVAAVFYICENRRIEQVIRQVDLTVGSKFEPKIYTCLEETVLNCSTVLPLTNRQGGLFQME